MKEKQEREKIAKQIDKVFREDSNIFQRIGWRILELMWYSLSHNRNY